MKKIALSFLLSQDTFFYAHLPDRKSRAYIFFNIDMGERGQIDPSEFIIMIFINVFGSDSLVSKFISYIFVFWNKLRAACNNNPFIFLA